MMGILRHVRPGRDGLLGRRGAAALEFALMFPVLLTMIGGVADFGLALWSRGRLSDAVTHGASYAFIAGPGVATATVRSAVQKAADASLTGTTVSVNGPTCFCNSGTPVTSTSAVCGSTCTGGVAAGKYVVINASFTYAPIFPLYRTVASTTLNESAVVRVQ
jgi:Flp pilus assembly protein TadG